MKKTILIVAIAILIIGCGHENNNAHDEHTEESKVLITEYSINMEVFAEADVFVVGNNSSVLAHFTWLENFMPLESGNVTISLIVGSKGIKQTLSKPERPGIYRFQIQPQFAGKGKIIFDIDYKAGKSQIIVENITVYNNLEDAQKAADQTVLSKTNTTVFTKEQSWKIDFRTDFPKVESFGDVIKTTALVESAQGDEIIVSAKIAGVVRLTAENLAEGKDVKTGQVLFSISGSQSIDDNFTISFNQAENNYLLAKSEYDRALELSKDRIVSEKDLLTAKNKFDNAKIVYDNINRTFSSVGQTVTSPMSGYITSVFVKNGSFVEAGQPVLTVSQNKSLMLSADLPVKYSSKLAFVKTANIRTIHNNQTYTLEQLNGKFLSYGKSANADNYLIPVKLQIDNIGDFTPGGFVELYIKSISNNNALTIPNSALLEEYGVFYVYVQINPELFEKREVKVGVSDGIRTEILQGITKSDRIVTKGAVIIKLAQSTGGLDAHSGHVH
jgi:membrane fusion protein, heavy metal efflux system